MIEEGNEFIFNAVLLYKCEENYLFCVKGLPKDTTCFISRSKDDDEYNQRLDEALEKLKV